MVSRIETKVGIRIIGLPGLEVSSSLLSLETLELDETGGSFSGLTKR